MVIEFYKADFQNFINSFKSIGNNKVTFEITKDKLKGASATPDSSSAGLFSEINIISSSDLEEREIYVEDTNKFQLFLDMTTTQTIKFEIDRTHIYFKNENVKKAKFALNKESYNTSPLLKSINVIESFNITSKMHLSPVDFSKIKKCSRFTSQTQKLYIFEEDGKILAELNDYENNTDNDSIILVLCENYEGHINGKIILDSNIFDFISFIDDDIIFETSEIVKKNRTIVLTFITIIKGTVKLKYLFNSKIK